MATDITIARMLQAGVVPADTFAVIGEILQTWNRPDAMEFAAIMAELLPPYRALMECHEKAQRVQREGHETKLDKQKA